MLIAIMSSHENTLRKLLDWYGHNRRDLPWRQARDPYRILISEVMLQQTQVERVLPKYEAWLDTWPTLSDLASASVADVLRAWQGLGYNRRAVALLRLAQRVQAEFGGQLPTEPSVLQTLPGIGPYTARAIAAFTTDWPELAIDTNVRRLLWRLFFGREDTNRIDETAIRQQIEPIVRRLQSGELHHAMMDFGSAVCQSRRPKCEICPLLSDCQAGPSFLERLPTKNISASQAFRQTNRFVRGRVIDLLREQPLAQRELLFTLQQFDISEERSRQAITELLQEGMIRQQNERLSLPE